MSNLKLVSTKERPNYMSGGPIDLKEGWAKIPFTGSKVHYWKPTKIEGFAAIHKGKPVHMWRSLCGVETISTATAPTLNEGNWPRCKKCLRSRGSHGN